MILTQSLAPSPPRSHSMHEPRGRHEYVCKTKSTTSIQSRTRVVPLSSRTMLRRFFEWILWTLTSASLHFLVLHVICTLILQISFLLQYSNSKRWSLSMVYGGRASQEVLNMTRYAGLIASFEYTTVSSFVGDRAGILRTYQTE
jgi:hypothetical protein